MPGLLCPRDEGRVISNILRDEPLERLYLQSWADLLYSVFHLPAGGLGWTSTHSSKRS